VSARLVVEDGLSAADGGQWLGATLGVGQYVALLGLLSLAVGALLRHSAGAITTMMGLVPLPLMIAIFMQAEDLRTVQEKLIEYSSPNAIASLYQMPMLGDGNADGVRQLVLLAIVAAAAAAYAALAKRDARPGPDTGPHDPRSVPGGVAGPLEPCAPAVPRVPAGGVPVAPVLHAAVLRPGHQVADTRRDLLVAAGAAVELATRTPAQLTDGPLLALPALHALRAPGRSGLGSLLGSAGGASRAVSARGHGHTPHAVGGLGPPPSLRAPSTAPNTWSGNPPIRPPPEKS
jgi:hypothetical protein